MSRSSLSICPTSFWIAAAAELTRPCCFSSSMMPRSTSACLEVGRRDLSLDEVDSPSLEDLRDCLLVLGSLSVTCLLASSQPWMVP